MMRVAYKPCFLLAVLNSTRVVVCAAMRLAGEVELLDEIEGEGLVSPGGVLGLLEEVKRADRCARIAN